MFQRLSSLEWFENPSHEVAYINFSPLLLRNYANNLSNNLNNIKNQVIVASAWDPLYSYMWALTLETMCNSACVSEIQFMTYSHTKDLI